MKALQTTIVIVAGIWVCNLILHDLTGYTLFQLFEPLIYLDG